MNIFIESLSILLIFSGCVFCVIGAIGLLRMPTFITRVHASSLIDSLGAILLLTGLILLAGFTLTSIKLAFILFCLLVTGPTAIHALVNTAHHEDSSYISNGDSPSKT